MTVITAVCELKHRQELVLNESLNEPAAKEVAALLDGTSEIFGTHHPLFTGPVFGFGGYHCATCGSVVKCTVENRT